VNLAHKATIPAEVMARQIGEETVILDLVNGGYFGLDAVGARIWELLAEGRTLGETCDAIVAEYEVRREDAERDLRALVADLCAKKLLSVP